MKKILLLPFTFCLLLFTFCLLLFTFCLLPFTFSFAEIPRGYFHKQYETFGTIPSRSDSVHSYDALSYEINLQLFPSTHYISGNVRAKIMAKEDNLTEVSYELEQLNVDSVFVNGTSATFSYDGEIITITLDQTYNIGDTLSTQVFYQGYPTISSDIYHTGIHWQTYIFTYSDPNGVRFWWPGYDHPWDKATTKMDIRVPDNMLTASNGILVDEIDNGDGTKTFYWDNTDLIATYLVSLCVGNYATFTQDYGNLPIINYVYPSHLTAAQSDFACIPTALGIYENHYGNYPFQKYGMAECGVFGGWGGMEHQTMTSIGSGLINGMGTYEWIFVHELAHQWFGDCLTPLTWKDVWLSEGFAVYSEALYVEGTQGFQAMCNYVESSFHQYYLNWAGGNAYTVYDPPYNSYFTPATYEKPASVLHMIRLMVGDSTFFNMLQTYFDTYKYGNVVTTDFIDVCESVSGMDLQEFFNDWIFGSGVPSFEFYYLSDNSISADTNLVIVSRSISNTDTDFEMQIPFEVYTPTGEDSIIVNVEPDFSYQYFSQEEEITDVQFDPHHWILNRGCTEILPVLDLALPGDNFVFLNWQELPYLLPDSHFSIYRSETSGEYEKIGEVPGDQISFVDTTAINGNTYYYKISYGKSSYNFNGESEFSNELSATPIPFPMDNGILLVDETKDGDGGPITPYDETVDSLYHYALQHYSITDYDYASEGPIELDFLSHYSTVIWYDDDYNQHLIANEIDKLASLLVSGGNLIISGWKTADYISDFFFQNFLNAENVVIIPDVDFLGAFGEDNYPYIDVNGEFIPAWNDRWAYITTFDDVQSENVLYRYDSFSGANDSLAVGLVNNLDDKNFVVLGFPLYFMQPDDVKDFYERILTDFGEEMGVDDWLPISEFKLYQNYPNPFSTSTTISFNLATDLRGLTQIKIYNIKGQLVKTLIPMTNDQSASCLSAVILWKAGRMTKVVWDGKDEDGRQLSNGIYFYKLHTDTFTSTKKCMILR